MNTELYDLCKTVYARTNWDKEPDGRLYIDKCYWTYKDELMDSVVQRYKLLPDQFVCPEYTSDYLLEKLPLILAQNNGSSSDFFFHLTPGFAGDEKWLAKYQDIDEGQLVAEYGATSLKALLKLTIALHDAGQLRGTLQPSNGGTDV